MSAFRFLVFLQLLLVLSRFLDADETVAIGVELVEVLCAADELARRQIAVVVAVHLGEPQGSALAPAAGLLAHDVASLDDPEAPSLAGADRHLQAARDIA